MWGWGGAIKGTAIKVRGITSCNEHNGGKRGVIKVPTVN